MITNETEKIQKIEIMKSKTMSNTNEKPKVDPTKVIVRPPVMIKGNAELPKGESLQNPKGVKK